LQQRGSTYCSCNAEELLFNIEVQQFLFAAVELAACAESLGQGVGTNHAPSNDSVAAKNK